MYIMRVGRGSEPSKIFTTLRHSFFIYKFIYFNWRLITLQYCIGFAIHQHESATGIHVLPILKPPPSSLLIPSFWVFSVYQPQASSIMHWTWTGNSFHIWYYTCFSAILPNHLEIKMESQITSLETRIEKMQERFNKDLEQIKKSQ